MNEYILMGYGIIHIEQKISESSKNVDKYFKHFVDTGKRKDTSCFEKMTYRECEYKKLQQQKKDAFEIIKKWSKNGQIEYK